MILLWKFDHNSSFVFLLLQIDHGPSLGSLHQRGKTSRDPVFVVSRCGNLFRIHSVVGDIVPVLFLKSLMKFGPWYTFWPQKPDRCSLLWWSLHQRGTMCSEPDFVVGKCIRGQTLWKTFGTIREQCLAQQSVYELSVDTDTFRLQKLEPRSFILFGANFQERGHDVSATKGKQMKELGSNFHSTTA